MPSELQTKIKVFVTDLVKEQDEIDSESDEQSQHA